MNVGNDESSHVNLSSFNAYHAFSCHRSEDAVFELDPMCRRLRQGVERRIWKAHAEFVDTIECPVQLTQRGECIHSETRAQRRIHPLQVEFRGNAGVSDAKKPASSSSDATNPDFAAGGAGAVPDFSLTIRARRVSWRLGAHQWPAKDCNTPAPLLRRHPDRET
jgi:hypothetical protein